MKNQTVYFFKHNGTDSIKIGMTKSNDVSSRFSAFCTYSPNGAKIVGVIKTENALILEKQLHKELKEFRLNGEFFNITEEHAVGLVNKYNSSDFNDMINSFWNFMSIEDVDSEKLKNIIDTYLFKKENYNKYSYSDLISKNFTNESANVFLTATEIKSILEKRENINIISMKVFGSDLKNIIGDSKNKKENGVVRKLYHLRVL